MRTNKAYSIKMIGETEAELNLYGEVVQDRPRDYWTGEQDTDSYIVASELIADLDTLKNKNTITVHINSIGGDLYAGVAIYNRLKQLPANIITINDGLAASAASIIFQAGDVRKVTAGSNLMVHQAMVFLYGYYQLNDLNPVSKELRAANKAASEIYAEASGRTVDEMKRLIDAETWMTGQEAISQGLADEIAESEGGVSMSLSADNRHIIVNGVRFPTAGMHQLPKGLPKTPAAQKVSNAVTQKTAADNQISEGGKEMDIKNVEDLQKAFPDLVNEIKNTSFAAGKSEGIAQGANSERERIKGIEAIANAVADKTMLDDAKFGENPLNAEQLAFKAMKEQAALGHTVLENLENDAKASGATAVVGMAAPQEMGAEQNEEAAVKADLKVALNALYPNKGVR